MVQFFCLLSVFVIGFIIFALTEVNQPRLLYFALIPREARRKMLYRRIVVMIVLWGVGLVMVVSRYI